MRPKKSLGQNFLMHAQTAERIVHAAALPEAATVLEIGPGTGLLTRALLKAGMRVIAVEADADLIPVLEDAFQADIAAGTLSLIHADVRSFDPNTISGDYHLVANIPYYITGEIIRQFLSATHKPRSVTLLVQKEVAERIARAKKESLLSISVKAYGVPTYRFTVPRGAFRPAPNVDSAVLSISDIGKEPFSSAQEEAQYFEVVRAGFAHKRKRLSRNLSELFPAPVVAAALAAAGLRPDIRAEAVPHALWRTIAATMHTT